MVFVEQPLALPGYAKHHGNLFSTANALQVKNILDLFQGNGQIEHKSPVMTDIVIIRVRTDFPWSCRHAKWSKLANQVCLPQLFLDQIGPYAYNFKIILN